MSEYQYVAFRAIDAPVSEDNLEYMRRQSTRAEITSWAFDNEYHFGDFRGDAAEMLRRGYDFHFHYANFGTRTLMIRLPGGLPDAKAAEAYFDEESLEFEKDKRGPGGILRIDPAYEPGTLDDLWEPAELLDRLLPLRAEILDGDPRPLYLARLAVATDMNHDPDEELEGPVPAGLSKLTAAQRALAELYGLDEALIAAAARGAPPLPKSGGAGNPHLAWLKRQPEARKDEWLAQLMADAGAPVRREILAEYRKGVGASWPTVRLDRTAGALRDVAEGIGREMDRKKSEKAARERAKKLADMTADPERTLRETERLVQQRSIDAYSEAARLLADLREALCEPGPSGLAEQQALKLKKAHPKSGHLAAALRREGFLKK